ncbi:hypothetical protein ACVFI8_03880 [Agarivorans sp. MS3-6]|uniref:hypothetical protein n=1 Tax=Agarivorans sp. TSD2052 TaxID=2937286 RepID=UPI00200F631E|nr:hypothetical protein [Agarivorans sp. TSD2052]UPW19836.1 hypothetical protein M0C34_06060 [Agarivorans sp. TSD2052]
MKAKPMLLASLILGLSCLSFYSTSAESSALQKVSYAEAQEMNLSKVAQKTFLNRLDLDLAEKEGLEWANTQNASHYSVYTLERSSKRERYRVSVVLYTN